MFDGKSVLMTGGTGSFGQHLVESMLARYRPQRLIVFSRDELKQSEMARRFDPQTHRCLRYFVGDVRDRERLYRALDGVDYVIHAAALKQVPSCEYNPLEAIKTNVLGAANLIDAAIDRGVQQGGGPEHRQGRQSHQPLRRHQALCRQALCQRQQLCRPASHAVLRGPLRQRGGKPGQRGARCFWPCGEQGVLPVTDARMTRFWITLEQGVDFVLKSFQRMRGGEIFIPKIPSMSLVDLARAIGPGLPHRERGHPAGREAARNDALGRRRAGTRWNTPIISPSAQAGNGRVSAAASCRRRPALPESFAYTSHTNSQWLSVAELRADGARCRTPQKRPESPIATCLTTRRATPSESFPTAGNGSAKTTSGGGRGAAQRLADHRADGRTLRARPWPATSGAADAVAVSSGTAALHAAMFALEIGPGDEVIVPAMTFAATANCRGLPGRRAGLCRRRSAARCCWTRPAVSRAITPRTRAVVAVDYAGQPCDYTCPAGDRPAGTAWPWWPTPRIRLGARDRGRPVGSLADLTTFSSAPGQGRSPAGEGGVVTTADARLAAADAAVSQSRHRSGSSPDGPPPIPGTTQMRELGYNYRLTDIQCALGVSQLSRLDALDRPAAGHRRPLRRGPGRDCRAAAAGGAQRGAARLSSVRRGGWTPDPGRGPGATSSRRCTPGASA